MLVMVGLICVPCSQTESFILGLVGGICMSGSQAESFILGLVGKFFVVAYFFSGSYGYTHNL